ncbi:MAG: hypothetical protein CMN91_07020 [Synechococcus sp. ARS1019]|nr:hypothetical protein [Synechococcus sp. ARS1019]
MFCIERQDQERGWIKEMCFRTAFKAYMNARTKSLVTTHTYRIIDTSIGDVVSTVEHHQARQSRNSLNPSA